MKYQLIPINIAELPKANIRNLAAWSNQELIRRYDKAVAYTKSLGDKDSTKYNRALRLIELFEDEGSRRQITPFIPEAEIQDIFAPHPTTITNDSRGEL